MELQLLSLVNTKPNDSKIVHKLKQKAKPLTLDKWTIAVMQKLATLLFPKCKSLLFFNDGKLNYPLHSITSQKTSILKFNNIETHYPHTTGLNGSEEATTKSI